MYGSNNSEYAHTKIRGGYELIYIKGKKIFVYIIVN